jgi:uncharacterized protein (UPF0216 family)
MSLNKNQVRIWLLQNYFKNKPLYTISFIGNFDKPFNTGVFEKSIRFLMATYSILNLNIEQNKDGLPVKVKKKHNFSLMHHDEEDVETVKLQNKCFDIENDLLFEIHVINNSKLLFVFSDLIIDGKSVHYFITELEKIYNTFLENKRPQIRKNNNNMLSEKNKNQLEFWEGILREKENCSLKFPVNFESTRFEEGRYYLKLKNKWFADLTSTKFQFVQSLLFILLYKYTKQPRIVIDTIMDVSAGTNQIGLFNNTVLIPFKFDEQKLHQLSYNSYLNQHKKLHLSILENRDVLLEDIVAQLDLTGLPNIRLHFEVKNTVNEIKLGETRTWSDYVENSASTIRQLMSFNFVEHADTISGYIAYRKHCFTTEFIETLAQDFTALIELVLENPSITLDKLTLQPEHVKNMCVSLNKKDMRLYAYKFAGKYPDINYQDFKNKLDTCIS